MIDWLDLLMDDLHDKYDPIIVDEAAWFFWRPETIIVVDCWVKTFSKPHDGPCVPGEVEYSVWVDWFGGRIGRTKRLYAITLPDELEEDET